MKKSSLSAAKPRVNRKSAKSLSLTGRSEPSGTVSKKFRAYLTERVEEACAICGSLSVADVISVIDSYISTGVTPDNLTGVGLALVFTILRPEIDRAVMRSAAARRRSASRRLDAICRHLSAEVGTARHDKSAVPEASSSSDSDKSDEVDESESVLRPLLSRRERRRREQELRRQSRQRIKPLNRTAGDDVR